jgi:hypothetical protein
VRAPRYSVPHTAPHCSSNNPKSPSLMGLPAQDAGAVKWPADYTAVWGRARACRQGMCVCILCAFFCVARERTALVLGGTNSSADFSSSCAFKSTAAEPDARRAESHTPTPTHTHTHTHTHTYTHTQQLRTHATHVQLTRGTAAFGRTLHLQRARTPPKNGAAPRCCGGPHGCSRNNGRDVRSREVSDPTRPLQTLPSVVLAGACSHSLTKHTLPHRRPSCAHKLSLTANSYHLLSHHQQSVLTPHVPCRPLPSVVLAGACSQC